MPHIRQLAGLALAASVAGGCAELVDARFDDAQLVSPVTPIASPCSPVHVAPFGDDASSGCSPALPMRTLGGAIAAAKRFGASAEVLVCAGTYDEAVTLDARIALRGGYDCETWTRTATFGFPTFDREHETIVGGSQLPQALRITGSAVDASVSIDGFSFLGAASGNEGTAVRFDDGAAPIFSDNRVLGGGTISETASGYGSVGMRVTDGAEPEVHHSEIDGGSGASYHPEGTGRAGLVIAGARPFLHDIVVRGGQAAPKVGVGGSVGLDIVDASDLTEAAGRPVLRTVIEGGDGNSTQGVDAWASIGVHVRGSSDVDLVETSVRPGDALGSALQLRGFYSYAAGAVRIVRSRVYGGDLSSREMTHLGSRIAAWVHGAESFEAVNSMFYGGAAGVDYLTGSPNHALGIDKLVSPIIRHNTLYSGWASYPTVGAAIFVGSVRGAVVENNVLAAANGWDEPLWMMECATAGTFRLMRNNVLFNVGALGAGEDELAQLAGYGPGTAPPCGQWEGFMTIDALTGHLTSACTSATTGACSDFGGSVVEGNVTLRADCSSDSGCLSWPGCPPSVHCVSSLFEEWSVEDDGLATMFGAGWKLASGVPCAVMESGLDLTATVADDLYGAPRTAAPSMGAHELDAACAP